MIIGAVAILTGCGVEDSTSIAPSESLDAVTLLTQASDSLEETETLRFNIEIDGDTFVDEAGTIRLLAARGDLARPDRVDVEFQVELLGAQTVSIRMITIDDEAWTTNLL
ncbi:MAG: LppX_LprAFG lipoprotein, partial [Chloroflexia bacterium]|nr:LppX_LprAFG lipoprotein [Chloroflexia bacterium]